MSDSTPLAVDLDGTLSTSDLLYESLFALLKKNALYAFAIPWWLRKGKAHMKRQISDRAKVDPEVLPYHAEFLDYLRAQAADGRSLVLATASDSHHADRIQDHLGIFDDVLASDGEHNLSGQRKGARLVELFGEKGFDYAGNSHTDLEVWAQSRNAILVNPDSGVRRKAAAIANVSQVFESPELKPRAMRWLKALRVHQWAKNLLVFLPLLLAHQVLRPDLVLAALGAFVAFSLTSSSVYILNDLMDLESDRRHPTKCNRPFAAGTLPIRSGALVAPALLLIAGLISLALPWQFGAVLALYYATTVAYSLRLKQVLVIDVIVLAGLYTLRIIAGAAAVSVTPSFWILAFSMFTFYSLALVKRYSELLASQPAEGEAPGLAGRGYVRADLEGISQAGVSSGLVAVLVLALYINSSSVRELYAHPEGIWLLCPILLYWITRVWLLARRDKMHEDPLVFALKDGRSHVLALIALAVLWASI